MSVLCYSLPQWIELIQNSIEGEHKNEAYATINSYFSQSNSHFFLLNTQTIQNTQLPLQIRFISSVLINQKIKPKNLQDMRLIKKNWMREQFSQARTETISASHLLIQSSDTVLQNQGAIMLARIFHLDPDLYFDQISTAQIAIGSADVSTRIGYTLFLIETIRIGFKSIPPEFINIMLSIAMTFNQLIQNTPVPIPESAYNFFCSVYSFLNTFYSFIPPDSVPPELVQITIKTSTHIIAAPCYPLFNLIHKTLFSICVSFQDHITEIIGPIFEILKNTLLMAPIDATGEPAKFRDIGFLFWQEFGRTISKAKISNVLGDQIVERLLSNLFSSFIAPSHPTPSFESQDEEPIEVKAASSIGAFAQLIPRQTFGFIYTLFEKAFESPLQPWTGRYFVLLVLYKAIDGDQSNQWEDLKYFFREKTQILFSLISEDNPRVVDLILNIFRIMVQNYPVEMICKSEGSKTDTILTLSNILSVFNPEAHQPVVVCSYVSLLSAYLEKCSLPQIISLQVGPLFEEVLAKCRNIEELPNCPSLLNGNLFVETFHAIFYLFRCIPIPRIRNSQEPPTHEEQLTVSLFEHYYSTLIELLKLPFQENSTYYAQQGYCIGIAALIEHLQNFSELALSNVQVFLEIISRGQIPTSDAMYGLAKLAKTFQDKIQSEILDSILQNSINVLSNADSCCRDKAAYLINTIMPTPIGIQRNEPVLHRLFAILDASEYDTSIHSTILLTVASAISTITKQQRTPEMEKFFFSKINQFYAKGFSITTKEECQYIGGIFMGLSSFYRSMFQVFLDDNEKSEHEKKLYQEFRNFNQLLESIIKIKPNYLEKYVLSKASLSIFLRTITDISKKVSRLFNTRFKSITLTKFFKFIEDYATKAGLTSLYKEAEQSLKNV